MARGFTYNTVVYADQINDTTQSDLIESMRCSGELAEFERAAGMLEIMGKQMEDSSPFVHAALALRVIAEARPKDAKTLAETFKRSLEG